MAAGHGRARALQGDAVRCRQPVQRGPRVLHGRSGRPGAPGRRMRGWRSRGWATGRCATGGAGKSGSASALISRGRDRRASAGSRSRCSATRLSSSAERSTPSRCAAGCRSELTTENRRCGSPVVMAGHPRWYGDFATSSRAKRTAGWVAGLPCQDDADRAVVDTEQEPPPSTDAPLPRPAKRLLDRMRINTEVTRDHRQARALSPHRGRLSRNLLVHSRRFRAPKVELERRPGEGANAIVPGPPSQRSRTPVGPLRGPDGLMSASVSITVWAR